MSFKYKTKPVVVEAASSDLLSIPAHNPEWLINAVIKGTVHDNTLEGIWVCTTRNGPVVINPKDMLIRLDDGEIYPCALEVFEKKYEKLD
jgi:hypothetical protein